MTFVDAQQGWAVGDRGVIWHTADGGRHWELQTSGVDCPLSAVEFIDARHGWAAGGWTKPFSHATHGVWLETHDGGEHWRMRSQSDAAGTAGDQIFRSRSMAGRSHARRPCSRSVSLPLKTADKAGAPVGDRGRETEESGRKAGERPTADADRASWLAGDFSDRLTGVLAGRTSALATVRRRGIEPARTADFGLRMLRRVRLVSETEGWLAGDGGLVLHTPDLGRTWQSPAGELPGGAAEHFDFQALAVRASADGSGRCWIAGSPGTRVFFTGDGGRTWQTGTTGQTLPIRDLTFVDDWHGWAVGDLGLILATEDGGRTWQRQQSGGGRAALAGFYAHAAEVPWELLAQLSGDEGYLSSIQIVTRAASEAADDWRCRFARRGPRGGAWHRRQRGGNGLAVSGARAGSAVVGRRIDRRLESSERRPRARSARRLSGAADPHLAAVGGGDRRQHGSAADRQADSRAGATAAVVGAESSVIAQAVLSAVERAADPTRHSGQIVSAGLQPWKVDKVFSRTARRANGDGDRQHGASLDACASPAGRSGPDGPRNGRSAGGGIDYQASAADPGISDVGQPIAARRRHARFF